MMEALHKEECLEDEATGQQQYGKDINTSSPQEGVAPQGSPMDIERAPNITQPCGTLHAVTDIAGSTPTFSDDAASLASTELLVAREDDLVAMEEDLDDTESVTSIDQSLDSSRSQTPIVPSLSKDNDNTKPARVKKKKRISKRSKSNPDATSEGETEMEGTGEHSRKPTKKRAKKVRKHCDTCPLYVKEIKVDIVPENNASEPTKQCDIITKTEDTQTQSDIAANVPKEDSSVPTGGDQDKQMCDTSRGNTQKKDRKTRTKSLCTCRPKKKRARPEPEGGYGLPRPMDEYDRIIYSNEPIFSDIEDNPALDERVRQEMERFHKRSHGNPDIFQVAQMVNSNTMLKFAIIGTELQNISRTWLKRAEGEVQALTRRIRLLEEDFEQTETRLQSASEKLEEASKAADESERARRALENRTCQDDDKIEMLEQMVKEATEAANDAEKKYDEVARKLLMTEAELERAEERAETAEAKIKELEEELHVVTNNLRSLEIGEEKASQREDSYEESIRDLTARLKDAENRATEAERTVSKLQKEVDRLEDELLAEKEKYKSISEELDQTFAELAGF